MASPQAKGRPEAQIGGAIPRFSWRSSLVILIVLGATGWSVVGTGFNLLDLLTSGDPVGRFLSGMFPPDLSTEALQATGTGIMETFQMSLLGAIIGSIVAFPLAALGTRQNVLVGSSRTYRVLLSVPYHLSRFLTNVFRSVPDILWALIFVVALGLGPFPGTLALAVHSAGVLGKLYGETLEAVPSRPVNALHSTGSSGLGLFLFGRLPQAMSGFTSLTLYMWESNIRSATILGFVGAGGIGQQILVSMQLFNYARLATLVVATVVLVLLVDRLSAAIRKRLVN